MTLTTDELDNLTGMIKGIGLPWRIGDIRKYAVYTTTPTGNETYDGVKGFEAESAESIASVKGTTYHGHRPMDAEAARAIEFIVASANSLSELIEAARPGVTLNEVIELLPEGWRFDGVTQATPSGNPGWSAGVSHDYAPYLTESIREEGPTLLAALVALRDELKKKRNIDRAAVEARGT